MEGMWQRVIRFVVMSRFMVCLWRSSLRVVFRAFELGVRMPCRVSVRSSAFQISSSAAFQMSAMAGQSMSRWFVVASSFLVQFVHFTVDLPPVASPCLRSAWLRMSRRKRILWEEGTFQEDLMSASVSFR